MKIAKIARRGKTAAAVVHDGQARLISPWAHGDVSVTEFDVAGRSLPELEALSRAAGETLPLNEVELAPPLGPMAKLICIGLNYKTHLEETRNDVGENPSLFTKIPGVLVGHNTPMIRPKVSEHFDFEGEITVVIGKEGRHIRREDALDHIFGYTIMNDGSVRDYQKHSVTAGKNFRRSGSLGPWIVTADEIPDPTKLKLETRLSGQVVQSTTANLMIFDIPAVIEYVSRWCLLTPGDVIATGTPGGVGARRTPPLWMKAGDRIEVEVSSIGVLSNPIEDEH